MKTKQQRLFIVYSLIIFSLLISFSVITYFSVANSIAYQQQLKSIQLMKEERNEHFRTVDGKTELLTSEHTETSDLPQLYFISDQQHIIKMPQYGSKLIKRVFDQLPHHQVIHHQLVSIDHQHFTVASQKVADKWWIYTLTDSTEAYHGLKQLKTTLIGLVIIYSFLNIGLGYVLSRSAILPYQQAAEREQRFVQDAAHELKTPLQVIRTASEVLNSYEGHHLTAVGKETLADIQQEIISMSQLINQLLDLNRYSHQISFERLNLSLLLSQLTERYPADCVVDIQPDIYIKGNAQSLKQIIYIALDNTVKYNDQPVIRISLTVDKSVKLVIHDNGKGVHQDDLPHIFERFYRSPAQQHIEGSGIGLSLLQTIVTAHKGVVSAENDDGLKLIILFPKV